MHVVLETDRLLLRRFTTSDVDEDALVELDSDPAVMRFLTGGVATPRHVVRDEILPTIMADYDRWPPFGRWAAIAKPPATEGFVGWFALRPAGSAVLDVTNLELGYRLRAAAWGRGYATEGSRALIDLAFAQPGTRRVYAETMAVNTASRRVMERVGMRLVRTFHLTWDDPIDGTEHGEVEYELLRADREPRDAACPDGPDVGVTG